VSIEDAIAARRARESSESSRESSKNELSVGNYSGGAGNRTLVSHREKTREIATFAHNLAKAHRRVRSFSFHPVPSGAVCGSNVAAQQRHMTQPLERHLPSSTWAWTQGHVSRSARKKRGPEGPTVAWWGSVVARGVVATERGQVELFAALSG